MGVIIQFDANRKKKDRLFRPVTESDDAQIFKQVSSEEARRLKALAQGKLEAYICESCGERFEVIDNEFPTHCPGCNKRIEWE